MTGTNPNIIAKGERLCGQVGAVASWSLVAMRVRGKDARNACRLTRGPGRAVRLSLRPGARASAPRCRREQSLASHQKRPQMGRPASPLHAGNLGTGFGWRRRPCPARLPRRRSALVLPTASSARPSTPRAVRAPLPRRRSGHSPSSLRQAHACSPVRLFCADASICGSACSSICASRRALVSVDPTSDADLSRRDRPC